MKLLNALVAIGLRTIAVIFALLAIPPAFFAALFIMIATTLNLLSDGNSHENP